QAVELLHQRHVAHLDLSLGNILISLDTECFWGQQLYANHPYIIDFELSKTLEFGPGEQTAIELPSESIHVENFGHTHLDPYSFDVWLLSKALESGPLMLTYNNDLSTVPWIIRWYIGWLRGNEAGCLGVCTCRPTVTRARWVLRGIRTWVCIGESITGLFGLRALYQRLRYSALSVP
ncbi:uncharacterized protein BXZ73DRAFT_51002, partial [Epithele typhae]|uniref:uncharacterized protein n=1 Tax=Epithele typhae TaxID=378194 RepID=UPI00200818D1